MLSFLRGMLQQRTFSQLRHASFAVRDLFSEHSDETGTLHNRFSRHVAIEGSRVAPLIPHTIRYADYFPIVEMQYFNQQLARTPSDQIPTLLMYAFTYRPSADPSKFVQVLNSVDEAAMKHLPDMDTATIYRTLYAWLFLMPNWIMRTDFYNAALAQISLDENSEKEHFMQLCFYLGLSRRPAMAAKLANVLDDHLEQYLPKLSDMDLAIVANAAFKTSTEIRSAAFNAQLKQHVLQLTLESENVALLITFLKSLRLQRSHSIKVCEHLSKLCTAEDVLHRLQPRALAHILAFFAENLWDETASTTQLVAEFMKRVNCPPMEVQLTELIRAKDITTFLWSTAQLNCSFTDAQQRDIVACLLSMVHSHEFEHYPDQLVDSCLSLWMMGIQSQELLRTAVLAKRELGKNRNKPKVESRLTVLLAAAAIQKPKWRVENSIIAPFNLKAEVPAYLKRLRADVVKCAQQLTDLEEFAAVDITRPINGINILGLRIQLKSSNELAGSDVFLELVAEKQTLKFSKSPIGMIRLKIELLKCLGHKTMTYPSQLATKDVSKLRDAIVSLTKADEIDEEQKESVHSTVM